LPVALSAFEKPEPDKVFCNPILSADSSRIAIISLLKIKVVPGSSRNEIAGWLGEALKVRVTANPEKGKANDAVISILAVTLRVPKKSVTIVAGTSSAQKLVKISGLSESEIRARLSEIDA
jgi:uncharacterized protein (TIGR00251 family)